MTKLKCNICGSTKGFYSTASVSYSGDTLEEIGKSEPVFLDWNSGICCEACDDDDVQQIREEANNA